MRSDVNKVFKLIIVCVIIFILIAIVLGLSGISYEQMAYTTDDYPSEYISEDENTFIIKAKKPMQINIVDDYINILDNKNTLEQIAVLKIKEYFSEFDYEEKELRYIPYNLSNPDNTIVVSLDDGHNLLDDYYGTFEYIYNEDELHKETFDEKNWQFYRYIDGDSVYIFLYNEQTDEQKAIVNYKLAEDEYEDKLNIKFKFKNNKNVNCLKMVDDFTYKKGYSIYTYYGTVNIADDIEEENITDDDIIEQMKKDYSYKKNTHIKTQNYDLYCYNNYEIYLDDEKIIFMPNNMKISQVLEDIEEFNQNYLIEKAQEEELKKEEQQKDYSFQRSYAASSNNTNNTNSNNTTSSSSSSNNSDTINYGDYSSSSSSDQAQSNDEIDDIDERQIATPIITFIPRVS